MLVLDWDWSLISYRKRYLHSTQKPMIVFEILNDYPYHMTEMQVR